MIKVIVESPCAGNTERNLAYARACMRDCLIRGEAPFAPHALYAQTGVLDGLNPTQRSMGISAGLEWTSVADKIAVYTDFGISYGMQYGIEVAEEHGRLIEYRTLPYDLMCAVLPSKDQEHASI